MNKPPIDWPIAFGNAFHNYPNPGIIDTSREWPGSYSIVKKNPRINKNYNPVFGYGLVNASAALSLLLEQPVPDAPKLGGNRAFLDVIKAPAVWAKGYTGQGVVVAVLDTGVNYNHPLLKDNIWINPDEIPGNNIDDDNNGLIDDFRGWNFNTGNNEVTDVESHGSHVAGIIKQIAPDVKIMCIRVANAAGGTGDSLVRNGVAYASSKKARIINISAGLGASVRSTFATANKRNCFISVSAGNSGAAVTGKPYIIFSDSEIIAVGAVSNNKVMANFSDRAGPIPINYVVAPGVNINSSGLGVSYINSSGTSMAAPMVSGVAALLLSANPNLTYRELYDLIISTATPLSL